MSTYLLNPPPPPTAVLAPLPNRVSVDIRATNESQVLRQVGSGTAAWLVCPSILAPAV